MTETGTGTARAGLRPLQPLDAPLDGLSLIEASAGTGKTYTIAALYLRLILEGERRVDQIAVVTFTNAATEELKQRIRGRLQAARRRLALGEMPASPGPGDGDPLFAALLARFTGAGRELALRRLDQAVRGFDEAAIHTIHGFCQRLLQERAFASGMPFEAELQRDERALRLEIVEDFWRRQFYTASQPLIDYLLVNGYTPPSLLREIAPHLGKPYLRLRAADPAAFDDAERAFADAYRELRACWREPDCRDRIGALFASEALNRSKYRPASLPRLLQEFDDYLLPETPNVVLFERFERFTPPYLEGATRKNRTTPVDPLFLAAGRLYERYDTLATRYQAKLRGLRAELLRYGDRELARRKRRRRLQSYDDLLLGLDRALDGRGGRALTAAVRRRYSAALVDEFQDTDPIQYAIFRRLYADSGLPVFFVGDPKQAIYSFRGADIFAYLQAHHDATAHFTLDRNWRSEAGLIVAVNALFGGQQRPFLLPSIDFHPVRPGDQRAAPMTRNGRPLTPLDCWFMDPADAGVGGDKPIGKQHAAELAAAAVAGDIARLLTDTELGRVRIGGRPLEGGDIAVLVRTHRQGALVRRALLRHQVPSVQHVQDSVFLSHEAEELERLLLAVADPGRENLVRAALATGLLGLGAADLYRCGEHESLWEQWLERFHGYHLRWREHGFFASMHRLLRDCGVAARLLSRPDGERRLTNLNHLLELTQSACHRERLDGEALLRWLAGKRQEALEGGDDEDAQLRLESDERLVQIVTVHKSKGLEYPLVYCPFLWEGSLGALNSDTLKFHDPDDGYRPILDLGSEQFEDARPLAGNEELAESLRLLYVALTRAKQRCVVVWGKINDAGRSPLGWLLHRPEALDPGADAAQATAERFQALTSAQLRAQLQARFDGLGAAAAVSALPPPEAILYRPGGAAASPGAAARLRARPFPGPLDSGWRIASFSAISATLSAAGVGRRGASGPADDRSVAAREDADDLVEPAAARDASDGADTGPARSAFTFPRGAHAGTCLHALFEQWEFTCDDHERLTELADATLALYGIDRAWGATAARLVADVLATPLAEAGTCLGRLGRTRRVVEMGFHYPLPSLDTAPLRRLLDAHPTPFRGALDGLQFAAPAGFMKGFIDLVFEAGGRYFLADYKSNWLGPTPGDYRPEALHRAMLAHDYWLQYLIYAIALHRYLALRLPGYDYDRHFGGVYYLFVRGMGPTAPGGVFFDRPERALVESLDRYICTGTEE